MTSGKDKHKKKGSMCMIKGHRRELSPPPKKLNSAKQIPMSALTIFSVAIVFHYNRYPLQNLSFYQIN